jgi:glucose/arabinose dehydrogenase
MRYAILILMLFLASCNVVQEDNPQDSVKTAPASTAVQTRQAETPTATFGPLPTATVLPALPVSPSPQVTVPLINTPLPTAGPNTFSNGIPDPSEYTWRPVAGGLQDPVDIRHAGDGSGRLFVVEQPGRILILQPDMLAPVVFLDLMDRVGSGGSEQGLLGLAFHPNYAQNGWFFVNYTDLQGDTVISRFQVSETDQNQALANTEVRLLNIPQPYANHNGGAVAFGPDGYLYLGLGDGGSAGDPQNNAQSLDTLLGKILRIDVDGGEPYAIPPDNPFAISGGRREIWAYGLRNPWRMSFDRLTGDLYIGDVGQNQWEEIDFLSAAQISQPAAGQAFNFGWVYFEGSHPYGSTPPVGLQLIPPVMEYSHQFGCSVTGGVVYRGEAMPAWQGIYLFADYCSGLVWGMWRDPTGAWQQSLLFENTGRISSFGEDERGEVYLVDYAGLIYQLVPK